MPQFVIYLFFAVLQAAGGHGDAFTQVADCDAGRKEFIEKHKEDLLSMSECVAVTMLPAGKPTSILKQDPGPTIAPAVPDTRGINPKPGEEGMKP